MCSATAGAAEDSARPGGRWSASKNPWPHIWSEVSKLRLPRTRPRKKGRTSCNEYQKHTSTPWRRKPQAAHSHWEAMEKHQLTNLIRSSDHRVSQPFFVPLRGRIARACSCWPQTTTPRNQCSAVQCVAGIQNRSRTPPVRWGFPTLETTTPKRRKWMKTKRTRMWMKLVPFRC